MKTTPEILKQQCHSIKYPSGGFLQTKTQYQLESRIGYQYIDQQILLLVSDREVDTIESSKSVIVSRRKCESGNLCTLSFELLQNEQHGVFAILCCDVIKHTRSMIDEEEALKLHINRYSNRANCWRNNGVL